jgi:putative endonuclease
LFLPFEDLQEARTRELQMKKWKRCWKIELIERVNPHGDALFDQIAI